MTTTNKPAAMKTVTIGTVKYATQQFNADRASGLKADDNLSRAVNAACIQIVLNGRIDWLSDILSDYTLKTGKLSVRGRELLDYARAHCPRIQFDAKTSAVSIKKISQKSALFGCFYVPFETTEDDKALLQKVSENSVFALTLAQWREAKAQASGESTEPRVTNAKASTLAKQFAELAEKAGAGNVIGTDANDWADMLAACQQMYVALSAAAGGFSSDVDMDVAARATGYAGKGKGPASARAPKKAVNE